MSHAVCCREEPSDGDFQVLAEEVPVAVFRCDGAGRLVFHNARWTDLVGHRPGVTRLHDVVHPADIAALEIALEACDGAEAREVVEVRSADGWSTWRVVLRALGTTDRPCSLIGTVEDVTSAASLRQQAEIDALTGLLNRDALEHRLSEVTEHDPTGAWVFFVDLDDFRWVNDELGREVGDLVLVEVASRLRQSVRPTDAVGRWGGDEFVILATGLRDDEADAISRRLEASLAEPFRSDDVVWSGAASVGAAPAIDGDAEGALRRADLLMFDAKRSRKACFTGMVEPLI